MKNLRIKSRERRHARIRAKISGAAGRPRLSVFRSNTSIYAQIIDDERGATLASARGSKTKPAEVGANVAKAAIAKGIKKVVFDRGGYLYAGKVRALADGARGEGLEF